jgi:serine protease Do
VSTSRTLQRFVADAGIDREVEVLIWRDGKEIRTRIKIARLEEPAEPAKPAEDKPAAPPVATGQVLGLDVTPLNDDTRSRFKIDPTIENGIVIVAVRPESPLKEANLRVGEIIVELGQKKIASVDEMNARLAELKKEGQSSALALVANPAAEMRYLRVPVE